jgi:hypothetical protein
VDPAARADPLRRGIFHAGTSATVCEKKTGRPRLVGQSVDIVPGIGESICAFDHVLGSV